MTRLLGGGRVHPTNPVTIIWGLQNKMEQLGLFDRLCVLRLDHKRQLGQSIDLPCFYASHVLTLICPASSTWTPFFDESVDERLIDINGLRIQSVVVALIDLCRGVNVTDVQKNNGNVWPPVTDRGQVGRKEPLLVDCS